MFYRHEYHLGMFDVDSLEECHLNWNYNNMVLWANTKKCQSLLPMLDCREII